MKKSIFTHLVIGACLISGLSIPAFAGKPRKSLADVATDGEVSSLTSQKGSKKRPPSPQKRQRKRVEREITELERGACVSSELTTCALTKLGQTGADAAAVGEDSSLSSSSSSSASQPSSPSSAAQPSSESQTDLFYYFPADINGIIAGMLTKGWICQTGSVKTFTELHYKVYGHINDLMGKILSIPEVTQADVDKLRATLSEKGIRTAIQAPIAAFKTPASDVSIKLWKAVMRSYPTQPEWFEDISKWQQVTHGWDLNPDLPAVYINLEDQFTFAEKLSEMTGRNFAVPTPAQQEYLIGRVKNEDGSFGSITTTRFWHGDDENEVQNYAWIFSNSEGQAHGVNEVPPIPMPLPPGKTPAHYQHPFGLINATGNVFKKASDGSVRGGAFDHGPEITRSSSRHFPDTLRPSSRYRYSKCRDFGFHVVELSEPLTSLMEE